MKMLTRAKWVKLFLTGGLSSAAAAVDYCGYSSDFGNPVIRERVLRGREAVAATCRRALASGVRVALGTDAMHGFLPEEIVQLVRLGAPPAHALRAATAWAAEAIGVGHRRGTLEPGKAADIISVKGNPLVDITCVRHRGCLYKDGVSGDGLSAV